MSDVKTATNMDIYKEIVQDNPPNTDQKQMPDKFHITTRETSIHRFQGAKTGEPQSGSPY